MTNKRIIAENLKYLLSKNDIKQRDLAKKVGVKEATVSRWVNGERNVTAAHLSSVADVFNVTMDEICGKEFGWKRLPENVPVMREDAWWEFDGEIPLVTPEKILLKMKDGAVEYAKLLKWREHGFEAEEGFLNNPPIAWRYAPRGEM